MDEVKIWAIQDESMAVALKSKSQVDTEGLLEETLVANPELLIPGLRLVGRQMPTEGGPLDLLGVDEDGRLVVFELKRGTLSREAVAQIIDYGSDLDAMDLIKLAEHISERSGEHGIEEIEDFQEWYSQDFGELVSLKPLRLFLVGLGADDRTERMVRFLAGNSGMDISLLTFHGFEHDGKTFLARQVEVEGTDDDDIRPKRRRRTTADHRKELARRIEDFQVRELFDATTGMFHRNWPESRSRPRVHGLGILLKSHVGAGRRASYARIGAQERGVRLVFFPRAKELCPDEFGKLVKDIQCQTWPRNEDPLAPHTEIQFSLTPEEWETHKERLYTLTRAVYEAWRAETMRRTPPDPRIAPEQEPDDGRI